MELTSISTIACIVPTTRTEIPTYLGFEPKELTYTQKNDEYQLSLQDEHETLQWKINKVMTPRTLDQPSDERQKLVDYALEGFDVASLSISVGNDIYRTRQKNVNEILRILNHEISKFKSTYEIEYAFVGMEDNGCHDFRKHYYYSNDTMMEKGMDGIMTKVNNLSVIKETVQKNSTLPTILTIKLYNTKKKTVGRLVLIDLLHPQFSHLLKKGSDKLFFSFSQLCNAVASITTHGKSDRLDLSSSFLMKVISKYISGHNKLVVFGFLNDSISSQMQVRETRLLLDFISSLKDTPVRMLSNAAYNQIENKLYKTQIANANNKIEQSNQAVTEYRKKIVDLHETINTLRNNFEIFDKAREEELNSLKGTLTGIELIHAEETEKLRSENTTLYAALEEKNIDIMNSLELQNNTQVRIKELEFTIGHLQDRLEQDNQNNQIQQSGLSKKLEHAIDESISVKKQLDNLQQENTYLAMQQERLKNKYDESEAELVQVSAQLKAEKIENLKLKDAQIDVAEQRRMEILLQKERTENARLEELVKSKVQNSENFKKVAEEKLKKFNKKVEMIEETYEKKLKSGLEETKKAYKIRFKEKLAEIQEYEQKLEAKSNKLEELERQLDARSVKLEEEFEQKFEKSKQTILNKARVMVDKLKPSYDENVEKIKLITQSLDKANAELARYKLLESSEEVDEIIPIRAKEPKIIPKINSRRRPQPSIDESTLFDLAKDSSIDRLSLLDKSPLPPAEMNNILDNGNGLSKIKAASSKQSSHPFSAENSLSDVDMNVPKTKTRSSKNISLPPSDEGNNLSDIDMDVPKTKALSSIGSSLQSAEENSLLDTDMDAVKIKPELSKKNNLSSVEENNSLDTDMDITKTKLASSKKSRVPSTEDNTPLDTNPKSSKAKASSSKKTKSPSESNVDSSKTQTSSVKKSSPPSTEGNEVTGMESSKITIPSKKSKHSTRKTKGSVDPVQEPTEVKAEVNYEETISSSELGSAAVRRSPRRIVNNSQSSTGSKRRKLRNSSHYLYFNEHIDNMDEMSPLSKFIQSHDTRLP